ncbi:MAG: nucleotidyl transferase AbiEii/AbiGii toxin family protein [Spirochaetaceae bacterium]|nr:nucleotidyl transferase AbiEii/AbiGii toxin family protein [Spirochaetaceae bacterium]
MKEYLKQLVNENPNQLLKKNVVREYLQARVLQGLQDSDVFLNWAFLGGTALRFLFNIPRYSEDLDFSLIKPEQGCEFEKALRKIKTLFESEKYDIQIKVSPEKTVMSAFLKFPGILYEMGISPYENEVLSIKFEIDTNPPKMANISSTIVRRFVTVNISHYDKASLLAGKLHAVLSRPYTKGRDIYDLIWYLSDISWPSPNFSFLNAALEQTNWGGEVVSRHNLKDILYHKISGLQWNKVQSDLLPFMERQQDLSLVTRENCLKLIEGKEFT